MLMLLIWPFCVNSSSSLRMEQWPRLFHVLSWTNTFCAQAAIGNEQPHHCHPAGGQSTTIQAILAPSLTFSTFPWSDFTPVLRAGPCTHLSLEIIVCSRSQRGVRPRFLCRLSLFQSQPFLLLNFHYWAKILHLKIRPTMKPFHGSSTKQQLKCLRSNWFSEQDLLQSQHHHFGTTAVQQQEKLCE